MEKRRYPRNSLRVPAFFSSHTLKDVVCAITDFCKTGICIEVIETDDTMICDYISEQDVLQVSLGPAVKNLKVYGLVVHTEKSSIGLRVLEDEEQFLSRLKMLLNEQDRVYEECLEEQSEEMNELDRLQEEAKEKEHVAKEYNIDLPHELASTITKYIRYSLAGTFSYTVKSMTDISKHVKHPDRAKEINEGRQQINDDSEKLVQLMLDDCLMELWIFFHPEDASNSNFAFNFSADSMEILGDNVLDSWVIMKSLGNEYEKQHQKLLTEIEIRVSYLMGKHIKPGELPFSPSRFCTRYYGLIHKMKQSSDSQALLMKIFERHFLKQIGKLYRAINNTLKEKGVLPNIRESASYRERVENSVINHFSSRQDFY